jgi:hypothetical protein
MSTLVRDRLRAKLQAKPNRPSLGASPTREMPLLLSERPCTTCLATRFSNDIGIATWRDLSDGGYLRWCDKHVPYRCERCKAIIEERKDPTLILSIACWRLVGSTFVGKKDNDEEEEEREEEREGDEKVEGITEPLALPRWCDACAPYPCEICFEYLRDWRAIEEDYNTAWLRRRDERANKNKAMSLEVTKLPKLPPMPLVSAAIYSHKDEGPDGPVAFCEKHSSHPDFPPFRGRRHAPLMARVRRTGEKAKLCPAIVKSANAPHGVRFCTQNATKHSLWCKEHDPENAPPPTVTRGTTPPSRLMRCWHCSEHGREHGQKLLVHEQAWSERYGSRQPSLSHEAAVPRPPYPCEAVHRCGAEAVWAADPEQMTFRLIYCRQHLPQRAVLQDPTPPPASEVSGPMRCYFCRRCQYKAMNTMMTSIGDWTKERNANDLEGWHAPSYPKDCHRCERPAVAALGIMSTNDVPMYVLCKEHALFYPWGGPDKQVVDDRPCPMGTTEAMRQWMKARRMFYLAMNPDRAPGVPPHRLSVSRYSTTTTSTSTSTTTSAMEITPTAAAAMDQAVTAVASAMAAAVIDEDGFKKPLPVVIIGNAAAGQRVLHATKKKKKKGKKGRDNSAHPTATHAPTHSVVSL